MPATKTIALVGDHDPTKAAHRAIPVALEIAANALQSPIAWDWVDSDKIGDPRSTLAGFDGVWAVPGGLYKNQDGIIAGIRHARENRLPFLGTCGGFQHMLIEFARNVAGVAGADTSETNPGASDLVVTPLSCSLVEKAGDITFTSGSQLHAIFGAQLAREEYRCSYGLNAAYRARLEAAGLRFAGFDEAGEIRGGELPSHPFFIGVLFQPERSALRGATHPLVSAFAAAVVAVRGG